MNVLALLALFVAVVSAQQQYTSSAYSNAQCTTLIANTTFTFTSGTCLNDPATNRSSTFTTKDNFSVTQAAYLVPNCAGTAAQTTVISNCGCYSNQAGAFYKLTPVAAPAVCLGVSTVVGWALLVALVALVSVF